MTENKNIVMREYAFFVDLSYRVQGHV